MNPMNYEETLTSPSAAIPFPPEASWITSPRPWGERAPLTPDALGAWLGAPSALADAPYWLETTFTVPEERGIIGADIVGAVRTPGMFALVHINGVRGSAGGEVGTAGAEYPAFEGDLSPWITPGENRLSVLVRPHGDGPHGVSLRLVLEYADGGTQEVVTGARWRVRPESGGAEEDAPILLSRGVDDGVPRKRFYATPFPAPLLRRAFEVPVSFRRAWLHVCGLGYHECWLNHKRVGDSVLDPAQTAYDKRAFYVTHDVTRLLRAGPNALGVMIADGWYGQDRAWRPHIGVYGKPAALVALEIERENGERRFVCVSDAAWRTDEGAMRAANIYRGEVYDARREPEGWTRPRFDDSSWKPVEVVPPRSPRLEPQTIPPMRRQRLVRPVRVTQPKPGMYVFDMGENLVGWTRLKVTAAPGTRIRLRYGEWKRADGTVDFRSTGVFATRQVQMDEFVCRGGGTEEYEPRFTYHGFQYVEVSGLPDPPAPDTLTGIVVHTDAPPAGAFSSSHPMLNQMETLARRSLVGNLHGIVTDCPHRERCEWNADAELIADYALYAQDAAPLFAKAVDDVATSLSAEGLPHCIAVGKRLVPLMDIGWATIVVQVPWRLYLFRGDREPARRHYDRMRRVLDHYLSRAGSGPLPASDGSIGDHAPPHVDNAGSPIPACPKDAYATTLLYESCDTLAKLAAALGKDTDADRYAAAARTVRAALLSRFYDPATGGYAHPTLDAYALLLGLYPEEGLERLIVHFHSDLARRNYMNIGGFFGYRRIAEAAILYLSESEALTVLTQDKEPGIPWSIRQGATSLWERMVRPEGEYRDLNSLNHFAFGSICENWWRHLAGIAPDPNAPGFRRVHITPRLTRVLDWVKAYHHAPHGRIRAEWSRTAGEFLCEVGVPPDTTAHVTLPRDARRAVIKAGRTPLWEMGTPRLLAKGIEDLHVGPDAVRLRLSPGSYRFRILGAEMD
jgi:alpha-L-rhamnosidase